MRAKTSDFLKVLNRARPEPKNVEKKTITLVYVLAFYHQTQFNVKFHIQWNFIIVILHLIFLQL